MNLRNIGEENSETIPLDLVIEILMKLPVKSIARFRCVSKLWESTLLSPYFTESFFTISSSRPKLLFTCRLDGKTLFFSSQQPQNSSSTLTASYHMSFPINYPGELCRPVRGLVCGLNKETFKGETVTTPLVCNPSTGQFITLFTVSNGVIPYFGYDPVDKQFKVLCIRQIYSKEHQVLTLGTEKKLSWRMIKCDIPHYPVWKHSNGHYVYDSICINGVLYYLSWVPDEDSCKIVCFEIRSEKFKCIRRPQGIRGAIHKSILVNYKGKLAILQQSIVNQVYRGIQLWVLEDAENHQWSSYNYVLPHPWRNIYEENKLHFVGMISSGEIVLSPKDISNTFYLLYYDPEMNTTKKVEILGMEDFKHCTPYTFLDHVEDVKLMESV